MTIVNHETGELIETLTEVEAKRLTDRIRLLAETVAEQVEKMADLIDQAIVGSAWLALGYQSWTAYVAEEFGGILPRLDREPRREFIRELNSRGMSTRAIAPVVGVDNATVSRDLARVASATPETPQGGEETSATDSIGASEARKPDAKVEDTPRPAVTGLDGKRYAPPVAVRPKATEADLSEVLDGTPSVQDARYMAALMKQLREVAAVHQFEPERIAALADDVTVAAINAAFENFSTWRDHINSKRSGLRVIKGGAR